MIINTFKSKKMENTDEQILSFRLSFLFNIYTQQELSKKLKITQWELLQKMKDKSFTENELLKIKKMCDEFTTK